MTTQQKLFDGKTPRLCISQWDEKVWARTLKELREQAASKASPSKQYVDKKDGSTVHTGYVIGRQWFTVYAPVEVQS